MSKVLVAAAALLFLLGARAHPEHEAPEAGMAASGPVAVSAVAAEVRKIDLAQHKLQLRHDYIPHLDMPPMSMVFEVREAADRALLPKLKVGQKLRFIALQQDGVYVARQLEPKP